jgi:diguanylate cyclase (GGDEF)-like protein/PAS domain S-box-containing protein
MDVHFVRHHRGEALMDVPVKSSLKNPSMPDLSQCGSEPIHIPAAIQPHGALLAATADGLLVSHASANLAAILGRPVETVLGRSLENAIGETACKALLDARTSGAITPEHVHSLHLHDGGVLNLRAHRTGRHICVDIEPQELELDRPLFMARQVVASFRHAASAIELCELAVGGLKALSGYDRVMAYRFLEDGHGEVIAEAREASLKAYLGQHYPASDIPPQARRLYLRQRVGAIVDSSYIPVPLCAEPTLDDGAPLDLTHSALRSASPIHREYMRNMNTAASLTIGLAYGSDLWGMLVCHHSTPRCAGFEMRAAADLIGLVVSLLIVSTSEAEVSAQRLQGSATLHALTDRLATAVPLPAALTAAKTELLHIVGATGAVLRLSGALICLGTTPSRPAIQFTLATLRPLAGSDRVAVDDLSLRYPELTGSTAEASGAMLLPLATGEDDVILWFRPDLTRTIVWGGDPGEHTTTHPGTARISPRTSFAAWRETVKGYSSPWTAADIALARAVRNAIEAEAAKRTQIALRESQAQLGLIVQHSSDVIILIGIEGVRQYVSPAVERMLGWRPEELVGSTSLLGNSPRDFVHPEDQAVFRAATADLNSDIAGEISISFRHLCRDGTWLWVDARARLSMTTDGERPGVVVALRDATERKMAEFKLNDALETMQRMAATDGLTGLANRRHFDVIAEKEWRRCARGNVPLAVLLLDADRFKLFNDRYGHVAGDACLCAIASQLAAAARRPGDLAARYGGEEFLMLMPDTNAESAMRLAELIRELVLNLAILHEGSPDPGVVTVSIGAAVTWPQDPGNGPGSVSALLVAADAALYQAKNRGRNQVAMSEMQLSQH